MRVRWRFGVMALRVAALTLLLGGVGRAKADVIVNLATGLDASNNLITTGGAPDAHWTVRGNAAQVVTPSSPDSGFPSWVANGPNSAWVARNAGDPNGNGVDNYFRTFDLTGLSSASITGSWTLDDAGTLSLNGHVIDTRVTGDWTSLHPFSVPAGSPFFNPGVNTLELSITSSDNFIEGVRLEGTLTAVTQAAAVPEPSSLALFALGGLAWTGWRRWKDRRGTAA